MQSEDGLNEYDIYKLTPEEPGAASIGNVTRGRARKTYL